MSILQKESKIFGSLNHEKPIHTHEQQHGGNSPLSRAEEQTTNQTIQRENQFLTQIHQELHTETETADRSAQEKHQIRLDRRVQEELRPNQERPLRFAVLSNLRRKQRMHHTD